MRQATDKEQNIKTLHSNIRVAKVQTNKCGKCVCYLRNIKEVMMESYAVYILLLM